MDPFPGLFNRTVDFTPAVGRVMITVGDKGGYYCGGTFRVTIFYHDSTEDFGGVDPFHPFACALEFIGGESAVRVL
jgi:hypothetical protein